MIFFAFMLSTLVNKQEKANQWSYSLILFLLFVDALFANCDFVLKLFYSDLSQNIFAVRMIVRCFEYVPSYAFSMSFGMIAIRAAQRFDYNTVSWMPGTHFGDEEYAADFKFEIHTTHDTIIAPSS